MTSVMAARSRNMTSAGILGYRRGAAGLEVLLVHPGGPFWRNKDDGAWSIPKGEVEAGGDAESTALREFREELGPAAIVASVVLLGEIRQKAVVRGRHIRKGLPNLLAWLKTSKPDVVCLQELKADQGDFRKPRCENLAIQPLGSGSERGTAWPFCPACRDLRYAIPSERNIFG